MRLSHLSKLSDLSGMVHALKIKNERNDETLLTFKVTAGNTLIVRVYPYFHAPIAIVSLRHITEGQCESIIQKVKELV